jgi:hypothetical protein
MNIDHYLRSAATAAVLAVCFALGACAERQNRDDFQQLIKGKTEPEVLKYAGKPDAKDEQKGDRHVWTYNSRTFNVEDHNKTDAKTVVIFAPGTEGKMTVAEVKYEN